MQNQLTIGIVGAGGFAAFASRAFLKVQGIRIKSITDIDHPCALALAVELGAQACISYDELLDDPEIDLIYIATPPYLHYEHSRQALSWGKHVICEKPAALRTSEAEELALFARSNNLLYTVNLMQRYNPLYEMVQTMVREKWLGDFLHGFFENYASDEKLIPEHWFWDKEKSGGIFIEHGVHFFDMFSGWFGKGELIHSMEMDREHVSTKVTDRAQAVVKYEQGAVNFYHGFNQPKLLDRQELRLQFDRGDITLYEWVPVKIRLHGLITNQQMEKIQAIFPDTITEIHHESPSRVVRGKFREIPFDSLVTISSGNIADKMDRYEQLIISMIKDQWNWVINKSHVRVIDDTNAVESLRIAEQATIQAQHY